MGELIVGGSLEDLERMLEAQMEAVAPGSAFKKKEKAEARVEKTRPKGGEELPSAIELDWSFPSWEDIRDYRFLMRSVNKARVSEKMINLLCRGADIVERGLEEKTLPKWVLRKFERWVTLWYGKGGFARAFPSTIVDWDNGEISE